jgi:hypothetical protein
MNYRLKGRYFGIKNSPEIFLKNGFEIKRGSCFGNDIWKKNLLIVIGGSEILEKKYLEIFFWKTFIRMFEPPFWRGAGGYMGGSW